MGTSLMDHIFSIISLVITTILAPIILQKLSTLKRDAAESKDNHATNAAAISEIVTVTQESVKQIEAVREIVANVAAKDVQDAG